MRRAEAAGVETPETRLIGLDELEGLPDIRLPDESFAYAIQRFDRTSSGRVHTKHFAQVFGLYPADKYQKVNYEQLGKTLLKVLNSPLTGSL